MQDPDPYGMLIVTVFVARHDDAHRGGIRRLASIRCQLSEAETLWKAWLANNTAFKAGYNSPLAAEFRPDSVSIG